MSNASPSVTLNGEDSEIFSLSYRSVRVGTISTGFSMRVDGLGTLPKIIKARNGSLSGSIGDQKGIISSTGINKTRTSSGNTMVVVDPFGEFLKKTIIIVKNDENGKNLSIPNSNRDEKFIFSISNVNFTKSIRDDYMSGDIESFFNTVTGGVGISLRFDTSTSPLVSKFNTAGGNTAAASINTYTSGFLSSTNITSVGAIIKTFIQPIGLEIYYEGNGNYICRAPKILDTNPSPRWTIEDESVIEINTSTDPYSAPDIVLPEFEASNYLGKAGSESYAKHVIMSNLSNAIESGAGGFIKVKTYSIPNLFGDNAKYCADQKVNGTFTKIGGLGPTPPSDPAFMNSLAQFYQDMARVSSYSSVNTGTITMDFNPEITHGYEWIEYDGEKWFMGDIRHEVARNRAITVVSLIGKEGSFGISAGAGTGGLDVEAEHIKFNKKQSEKVDKAMSSAKRDSFDSSSFVDDYLKTNIKKVSGVEDMNLPEWTDALPIKLETYYEYEQ